MLLKPDFSHAVTPHNISLAAALGAIAFAAAAAFWPHQNTEQSYTPPVQATVVADVQPQQSAPSADLN